MQNVDILAICSTKTGRFKVYWQGQADGHVMDWNGPNYRYATAEGQPTRGFLTWDAADQFLQALEADKTRYERERRYVMDFKGTSIPETRYWLRRPLTHGQRVSVGCVLRDSQGQECHALCVVTEDQVGTMLRLRCDAGHDHAANAAHVSPLEKEATT